MILTLPNSTLFPYTPLFRSRRPVLRDRPRADAHGVRELARVGHRRAPRLPPLLRYRATDASEDRKSTRLNSSHEWMSYAVVRSKKKDGSTGDDARANVA